MKKKSPDAANSRDAGPRRDKKSRRNAVVLALLLGSLTATSMLLLALAPPPLDPYRSLSVAESQIALDDIFNTPAAFQDGRWRYIYIHHSKAPAGNALSLGDRSAGMGDHFLVGNGNGCEDGAIQIGRLWEGQQQAHPRGATVESDCISICLVGDFDEQLPTDKQLQRLEQLVKVLQERCNIAAGQVTLIYDRNGGPGGIGRQFPREQFVQHLLP